MENTTYPIGNLLQDLEGLTANAEASELCYIAHWTLERNHEGKHSGTLFVHVHPGRTASEAIQMMLTTLGGATCNWETDAQPSGVLTLTCSMENLRVIVCGNWKGDVQ